jgi:hypothetical protein
MRVSNPLLHIALQHIVLVRGNLLRYTRLFQRTLLHQSKFARLGMVLMHQVHHQYKSGVL